MAKKHQPPAPPLPDAGSDYDTLIWDLPALGKRLKAFFSTPAGIAALAALGWGLATHLFALTNSFHNYDDIAVQPNGYGTSLLLGRWFLMVLGDILEALFGNYNLPLVNGLALLILLALSAALTVRLLEIRSRVHGFFIGALFSVFPTVASSLFFRYTSVFYGTGILLAVLAAWAVNLGIRGIFLSAVFTALSLGIYQAYPPVTIGIMVLALLRQLLEDRVTVKALFFRGLRCCAALVAGVVLYYLVLEWFLIREQITLMDYQGVSGMGRISLGDLPGLILRAILTVCALPVKNVFGVSGMGLIRLAYLILGLLSVLCLGVILFRKGRRWSVILMALALCAAFLAGVDFLVVMCPDAGIYTIMVYGLALVGCAPCVFAECLPEDTPSSRKGKGLAARVCAGALALLIGCYAYETNVNYMASYFTTRQMENYAASLVTQIRMTEGFDPEKKWALLGQIDDPLMDFYWPYDIRYGGNYYTGELLNLYSRFDWIRSYVGYRPEVLCSEGECALLQEDAAVQAMPCWPAEGSIQVIGDYVVVKFSQ